MCHAKGLGVFLNLPESRNERIGKTIGNLQTHTQQHTEHKEQRHAIVAEERKGMQPQRLIEALMLPLPGHWAVGQEQGGKGHADAQQATEAKLQCRVLNASKVHHPHAYDKAHSPPYTDGRKGFHRIKASALQHTVGHAVAQGNGRHIESNAEHIASEKRGKRERPRRTGVAIIARGQHHQSCNEMTDTQHPLGGHPAIGNDADESGHAQRCKTLGTVEPAYFTGQTVLGQIGAHAGEISTPDGKLQEEEHCQLDSCFHNLLLNE